MKIKKISIIGSNGFSVGKLYELDIHWCASYDSFDELVKNHYDPTMGIYSMADDYGRNKVFNYDFYIKNFVSLED